MYTGIVRACLPIASIEKLDNLARFSIIFSSVFGRLHFPLLCVGYYFGHLFALRPFFDLPLSALVFVSACLLGSFSVVFRQVFRLLCQTCSKYPQTPTTLKQSRTDVRRSFWTGGRFLYFPAILVFLFPFSKLVPRASILKYRRPRDLFWVTLLF